MSHPLTISPNNFPFQSFLGNARSPLSLKDLDLGEIGGNLTWLPPVDDSEVGQFDSWKVVGGLVGNHWILFEGFGYHWILRRVGTI